MSSAFGWLQQLWEFIVSCIPHLDLLRVGYGAVKYKGSKAYEIKPGLYWWMPLLTNVVTIPVNRQTNNLGAVVVPTKDSVEVALSPVVVYRVKDVYKAIVETDDLDEAIGDTAYRTIGEEVAKRTYGELRDQFADGSLTHELSKRVRSDLRPLGAHVETCFLSELTRKFHRLIGNGLGPVDEE